MLMFFLIATWLAEALESIGCDKRVCKLSGHNTKAHKERVFVAFKKGNTKLCFLVINLIVISLCKLENFLFLSVRR